MAKLTVRSNASAFGRFLTARMVELGIDDKDVARETGRSVSTIRSLRRLAEQRPTGPTLQVLAKAVQVPVERLQALLKGSADYKPDSAVEVDDGTEGDSWFDEEIERLKLFATSKGVELSLTITIR